MLLMKKKLFLMLGLIGCTFATAQNPIIRDQFSADPTARVFNDKVYLFPSHDIISPVQPERKWFCMADYHMFSSENLTDWNDHGVILNQEGVPWGNPKGFAMWAPDCVEQDGKYYFYFPDAPKEGRGFGIGIAICDDLVSGKFVCQEKPIQGAMGIDPCVMQTSKGDNYLFYGGGMIQVAKLGKDMMSIEGKPTRITTLPKGFVEGPFAFEKDGKYYLTYPWVREDGGTECIAYAMADDPLGPYEHKGIIMKEHENKCWTNHHSIVKYKDQWYMFYHNNALSPWFDKNRSVCCDSLSFNPDGTIKEVIPTLRGVGVTDARGQVQMDRYSQIGGGATVEYNDTVNRFNGWKVILPAGGWVTYGNVKVPEGQYKTWVNMPGRFGRAQLREIEGSNLELTVTKQPNGLSTLKLTNKGNMRAEVDWISLNSRKPLAPSATGGLVNGQYRNLFLEAGYTQEQIDKKLQEVFNDVFKGKNKCYFEVGKDMAYISDIKNNDVRTEGMSYGLMIAVQFDRKDIFDRLWRWAKKYMQIEEGDMKGYFRWTCKTDGSSHAFTGPASDGELYFITSLIFASNRWGNLGEINYLQEAQYILDAIQPKEVEQEIRWERGKVLETPKKVKRTVSLIDPATQLIAFTPGSDYTDPSYHLPAFYDVWAKYAEDGRSGYWRECAQRSREYLHKSINSSTGLNPDYNNYDGSQRGGRGIIGDAFRFDSWRVPMNIALDYSWACADRTWQQNYGETIQRFFYSKGLTTFGDQYNVDGTEPQRLLKAGNFPEKERHSIGLVATTAAASLMCSHAISYEFIDQLWNMPHKPEADGYFDAYYDGLLRLFAFMHLSGNYRVIEKKMQFESYFAPVSTPSAKPDEEGFVRRWLVRDPIDHQVRSNTAFVDTYIQEQLPAPIKVDFKSKDWHALDAQLYNVKLYRMATTTGKQRYNVIFWATTDINCDEDLQNIRLSVGSNSASRWWIDGKEVLMLSGDRRMVRDDMMSARLNLTKGKHTIMGAVINGPGMSDFCVRFVDEQGKPVTNYNITIPNNKK